MFRKNTAQQMTLNDPTLTLPKYLQRNLEKSWAVPFYEYVFSNINEERFKVLYSNEVSRPNSPVNVLIGLLILKENFGLTDEDLIGSLHFDLRFQYALGTTSAERQPVSINSLGNFRCRLVNYEKETGINLIKQEIEALAEVFKTTMNLDGKMLRMDSMMISSSCKKLSRIELIYTTNCKLVKTLNKLSPDYVPSELSCYLKEGHKNETIYKTRDTQATTKLEWLLSHSLLLNETCIKLGGDILKHESYALLERLISEQTKFDDTNNIVPKEGKELTSDILQNPSDPDATFREKYEGNIGYVGNIVESFNDSTSVITQYDIKQNIYADIKFSEDVIDTLKAPEGTTVLVDGAYYSYEINEKAKAKGIDMKPGQLVGKAPCSEKVLYAAFEVDEETNEITSCPNKEIPQMSYYSKKSHTAKFKNEQCENCPFLESCPVKKEKKGYSVKFSSKSYSNSKVRNEMKTKEYIQLTNKRAGVEGIPSVIRRKYQVDTMPVRGLLCSKLWFGFKIGAYNFNKLLRYLKKKGILASEKSISLYFYINNKKYNRLRQKIVKISIFLIPKTYVFVG